LTAGPAQRLQSPDGGMPDQTRLYRELAGEFGETNHGTTFALRAMDLTQIPQFRYPVCMKSNCGAVEPSEDNSLISLGFSRLLLLRTVFFRV
jgi:hypothetical protein